MNRGTEKKLGRKDLAKKKYRYGPEYSKVAHVQTSHFQKELKKLEIIRIPILKKSIISKQDYP